MLLPNSVLSQISFYEETSTKVVDQGVYTIVTLHFKAWYRFRKVIRIRWTSTFDRNTGTTLHTETRGSIELRDQLREYFKPVALLEPEPIVPTDRSLRSVK